ncbi:ClbS/DfsB family four-helix bundle protein [Saccharibacillus sacchari]|uniref:ClbS/DfsB family four-helix bundle protein n=1 Tax=Saccharibacillus sacchari TaxID=456493 RepID=UPI0004B8855C|nr:ClbS/DfsB family four-helix bundle protein [Saccharibacillus sacchari]
MPSYDYASKHELKAAIHAAYLKLDAEYDGISDADRDARFPDVDRTPAEIWAYQLGWGDTPKMPAPGYKWNPSLVRSRGMVTSN